MRLSGPIHFISGSVSKNTVFISIPACDQSIPTWSGQTFYSLPLSATVCHMLSRPVWGFLGRTAASDVQLQLTCWEPLTVPLCDFLHLHLLFLPHSHLLLIFGLHFNVSDAKMSSHWGWKWFKLESARFFFLSKGIKIHQHMCTHQMTAFCSWSCCSTSSSLYSSYLFSSVPCNPWPCPLSSTASSQFKDFSLKEPHHKYIFSHSYNKDLKLITNHCNAII